MRPSLKENKLGDSFWFMGVKIDGLKAPFESHAANIVLILEQMLLKGLFASSPM